VRVKASRGSGGFDVTGDGRGVEGRAGLGLLAETADRVGLTAALSGALRRTRPNALHDPGRVARDLVVMLADGGTCVSDIEELRRRDPVLFGGVASQPTAWRTVEAAAADELVSVRLAGAAARVRAHVWGGLGAAPGSLAAEGRLWLDLDATVVTAHSDKQGAAGTYKGGFGFAPIIATVDRDAGRTEPVAALLRPGNRPAHAVDDNAEVLEQALQALPGLPEGARVVVRGDQGLATKGFLGYAAQAGCGFLVSFEVTEPVKQAIRALPEHAWQPAVRQDGDLREGAAVAELTGRVVLPEGWPQDARLVVRREPLHPGAQQTLFDDGAHRYTTTLTDQPDPPVEIDRRHRGRAHIEDAIRDAKASGLGNLPCGGFDRNQVWVALVMLALSLTAWAQALLLHGEAAVARPATLRHRLWHAAARITRHARRVVVAFQYDWPWTADLLAAFQRLRALPPPA
jgi:hypothetical protein